MDTGKHLGPGEGWGEGGEEGARLQRLLELVRREHLRTELSPERRVQLRERVLERLEKYQVQRRRRRRVLVAAASTVLLAGLMMTLVIRARAG